ncbi:MAG: carboxypeptidase regulatory-like domain-containing protein [Planctomycetes bacterium]|nr:carboxypeptidase regulatory-like domain-containing protein [Planctomycetota bacterium]
MTNNQDGGAGVRLAWLSMAGLVLAAFWWLRSAADAPLPPAASLPSVQRSDQPANGPLSVPPDADAASSMSLPRLGVDRPAPVAEPVPSHAVLHGRCIDVDALAVPGCRVAVTSYPVDGAFELRPEVEVAAGADGHFECRVSADLSRNYRLRIDAVERVVRSAMLGALQPGQVVDLGAVFLFPGTQLSGRLVDGRGRLMANARVHLTAVDSPPEDRLEPGFLQSAVLHCDEQGNFTAQRPVRCGRWQVAVPDSGVVACLPEQLQVEGANQHCEIVVQLGQRIEGRVLDGAGQPVAGLQLQAVAPSGGTALAALSPPTNAAGGFALSPKAGQEPVGLVRIELLDPGAGDWLLLDPGLVEWGTSGVVVLAESKPTVQLLVRDAESGAPVADVRACLRQDRRLVWSTPALHAQGGHRLRIDEPAARMFLSVMVPSGAHAPLLWRELAPAKGAVPHLTVTLAKASELTVRVLAASGQLVVGAEVAVVAGREVPDFAEILLARPALEPGNIFGYLGQGPWAAIRTRTGPEGTARLLVDRVASHASFLRVTASGLAPRVLELPRTAAAQDTVDVQMAEGASLRGVLRAMDSLDAVLLVLRRQDAGSGVPDRRLRPARDGAFEFRDVEAGTWHLQVMAAASGVELGALSGPFAASAGEVRDLGRLDYLGPLPAVVVGRFTVQGVAPEGAVVQIRGDRQECSAVVAGDGQWRVAGVLPGSYRVVCGWRDRQFPLAEPLQVGSGALVRVERNF